MNDTMEHNGATTKSIEKFAKDNGIEVKAKFVPWSKSRSFKAGKNPHDYNLNWKVTLACKGRDIITTDYSAGIGHAPAYKAAKFPQRWTMAFTATIESEVESGFAVKSEHWGISSDKKRPIMPGTASVLSSLALDASVIDHGTFESWASDFGYDADSRSAEKTYRDCLEIALKIRAGLGEKLFGELREAVQGY